MRFKVDENLPVEVADLLRAAGHDALTILDQQLGGRPDRTIADIVRDEERALITLDLDGEKDVGPTSVLSRLLNTPV